VATNKTVGGVVDAPALAAAPFGLVNRITLTPDVDRWEGGVAYESLSCAAKVDLWDLCDPNETNVSDGTGKDRIVSAPPMGITVTDTCTSTFGADFRNKAEGRVKDLLEASTQKALEFELKWGAVASQADPVGRWLTGPGTVIVDSSGVSPKAAIALLEDAYADCGYGGAPVLHLTRGTAGAIKSLVEEDGVLFTKVGSMVIAGSGYSTSDPSGGGAWDGTWAFATGPVQVWLGDPAIYPETLGQAVDVAKNDIRFKAERLAAVAFDGCCTFAVKVDLNQV
jgi:hypothetical protein